MKKYFIVIFLMLFGEVGIWSSGVKANEDLPLGTVVINEILPGSNSSASQEYIELYNTAEDEINLEGWTIQYASATGLTWKNLSNLVASDSSAPAQGYFLLATPGFLDDKASATFSATIAQTGGQLRLVNADGFVEDSVSWGTFATMALGTPAQAPSAGLSIARKTNLGMPTNIQNNLLDFDVSNELTPAAANITLDTQVEPTQPPLGTDTEVEVIEPGDVPEVTVTVSNPQLIPIKISEILPNPASPKTDENDEFVELYNPNNIAVDLTGYTIVAGNNDNYKYTLTTAIPANSYTVFYSNNTPITLGNASGKVKLLDHSNSQVDATSSYSDSPEGQSWVLGNGGWVWTTTPTPGAPNILTKQSEKPAVLSTSSPKASSNTTNGPFAALEVSELLPNPSSPQTDADDEFVELYNPNNRTVNLTGYQIITGLKGNYKYTFKGTTIPAKGYIALFSRDSSLTLSNTSGKAKLLSPSGSAIDETGEYGKADDGHAWIYANGKWQWTVTPTPGKANIYKATLAITTAGSSSIANRGSGVNGSGGFTNAEDNTGESSTHPMIIAGVGGLALLYALYEYRHDLANRLHQLRRYREARRTARQAT